MAKDIDLKEYRFWNSKGGGYNNTLVDLGIFFSGNDQTVKPYLRLKDIKTGSLGFLMYYHIRNIVMDKYKITGLPKYLKFRNFWRYLFTGKMIFFKEKKTGNVMFSSYVPLKWNDYWDPKEVRPIFPTPNGDSEYNYTLKEGEFVEVLFNPERHPLLIIIGEKLAQLDWLENELFFDTQISRPFKYVEANGKDDLTVAALNEQISKRELFKPLFNVEDKNGVNLTNELVNGKMEFVLAQSQMRTDGIHTTIDYTLNQLYELLGLSRNENNRKKERMIQPEIKINNETKRFYTNTIFNLISEGIEEVNSLFGTNIKIVDTEEEEMESVMTGEKGGDDDQIKNND